MFSLQKHIYSLLFLVFSTLSFAQSGVYRFLSLPSSSYIAAFGGENVSNRDKDLSFFLHNPALLNSSQNKQLSFNGVKHLSSIGYGSVAYAHEYDKLNTFGAGVLFANYGDFKGFTENKEYTGNFTASDVALFLSYSKVLSDKLLIGGSFKPIFSSYESYSSFGIGIDLGLNYYDEEKYFSSGIVLKNIGSQIVSFNETREKLPFEIVAGFTKKLAHAPFQIGITAIHLEKWKLNAINDTRIKVEETNKFGENLMKHLIFNVEFLPSDLFHLSIGYNYKRKKELQVLDNKSLNGFSIGGDIKMSKLNLGFAIAKYHTSGSAFLISITTDLNSFNF